MEFANATSLNPSIAKKDSAVKFKQNIHCEASGFTKKNAKISSEKATLLVHTSSLEKK